MRVNKFFRLNCSVNGHMKIWSVSGQEQPESWYYLMAAVGDTSTLYNSMAALDNTLDWVNQWVKLHKIINASIISKLLYHIPLHNSKLERDKATLSWLAVCSGLRQTSSGISFPVTQQQWLCNLWLPIPTWILAIDCWDYCWHFFLKIYRRVSNNATNSASWAPEQMLLQHWPLWICTDWSEHQKKVALFCLIAGKGPCLPMAGSHSIAFMFGVCTWENENRSSIGSGGSLGSQSRTLC